MIGMMAILAVLVSCNLDDEASVGVDVDSEESIEAMYEDVDVLSDAGLDASVSGRLDRNRDELLDCATITNDQEAQVITIDFGDGCEGADGRVRSGMIIVTYAGRKFEIGSSRSITFQNFKIDSVQLEGTRTITNVSNEGDEFITRNTTLVNGKITFEDGTFATREATHTRMWYRALSPEDDYATLTGSASGQNREGIEYTAMITNELRFSRGCGQSAWIPVSGVKELTIGEEEVVIDFGDGTCDNLVTIIRDGETTEEELQYNPPKPRPRFTRG